MKYIDEKFKEAKPKHTVAKIKKILDTLGIEVTEKWSDSGVKNCFSLSLSAKGGIPSANGKGITKDFARASAYGEFIERLQGGLFFYKFQSIGRDPEMNIQTFAPDAKYMTVEELIQNGEWMDLIINAYGNSTLTREAIAEQCKIYACADDGKILTIPFYSLFEKKHIFLPIDFIDQMYATNGCCVGNSRDEAWVHALSEILERNANLAIFTTGKSAPKISDDTISKYPIVSRIIKQIKEHGDIDIDISDYSSGRDFPIVSTRIIDKNNHSYRVNVAADPIFEIALQRTLTELFQGKTLKNITTKHKGTILNKVSDFPIINNITNQLETGSGVYTADFFANELTCTEPARVFTDNTNKSNKELLEYILNIFRQENRQVYVRNFSYLGFACYRFVVPGFSEAYAPRLHDTVQEYDIADKASKAFKNPIESTDEELRLLLNYSDMIKQTFGRYNLFNRISGVPISGMINPFLANLTRAYASYRLKSYDDAIHYTEAAANISRNKKTTDHLICTIKYLELKKSNIEDAKITSIINKFFTHSVADKFFTDLKSGKTPFDDYLLKCDFKSCEHCEYKPCCCYHNCKNINEIAGNVYRTFTNGQDASEFTLD